MGKVNLLKANWIGKVGQIVGAKWKDVSTIRSFTKPSNPNTPAQQIIRQGFKELTSYIALFSDQIKTVSALPTKGMSVRNAIMHINAEQIAAGSLDEATLIISRGGLPNVQGFSPQVPAGLAQLKATWTPAAAATISAKAKVVVIFVNQDETFAAAGSALNSAGQITLSAAVPPSVPLQVYFYVVDYRGSSRVGSVSQHTTATSPAA